MSCQSLLIGDANVPTVSSGKSLAVHIRGELKEINQCNRSVKRVRQIVPPSTLQTMYNSFIQPYFDYCSVVWEGLGSELA